jgi:hypothetical protein
VGFCSSVVGLGILDQKLFQNHKQKPTTDEQKKNTKCHNLKSDLQENQAKVMHIIVDNFFSHT